MLDVRQFDERPRYATYDTVLAQLEREVIQRVNQRLSGQDSERVYAELLHNLEQRLPTIDHDERNLRSVAQAISRGDFPDRVW